MIIRLTVAALLTATSALAGAQGAESATEKSVSRSEISSKLDADYASLDANKDGKAGSSEIEARLKAAVASEMAAYKKERDQAFTTFDTDGNGTISRAEFDARAKLPTAPTVDATKFLGRFDSNKDGAITKDEFRTPTLANFDRADTNKDGTLTPAEQKAALETAKKISARESKPTGR